MLQSGRQETSVLQQAYCVVCQIRLAFDLFNSSAAAFQRAH